VHLSIIVPVYNAQKTIETCLSALVRELGLNDELIVVDDFSNDQTPELIKKFLGPNVKVISVSKNQGQGACRNKGVASARIDTDAFVFIDSDIEVKDGSLEIVREAFLSNPHLSALTGMISIEHPYKNFFSVYKNTYMNTIFSSLPREVNFLYGGVCAMKKADFISWPHYDLLGEDTQLGLTLSSSGKKIELIKELEVIHHKYYSLRSIIKNDFMIPFGFAKSFLFFLKQIRLGNLRNQSSQFSHVSPRQLLGLILSSSTFLALCLGLREAPLVFVVLCLGSLFVNSSFLLKLTRHHGPIFALKGILWTFIDQVIMTCGAFFGLIYHGKILISKKSKEERLEHY
jgi:glycosyltransferase involved in cell wall biosynthesis